MNYSLHIMHLVTHCNNNEKMMISQKRKQIDHLNGLCCTDSSGLSSFRCTKSPGKRKPVFNSKGADQPAQLQRPAGGFEVFDKQSTTKQGAGQNGQMRRMICTFVVSIDMKQLFSCGGFYGSRQTFVCYVLL